MGQPSGWLLVGILGKQNKSNEKDYMKISDYKGLLLKSLPAGRKTLAVGPPGVGKSHILVEAAEQIGFDVINLCCPLLSPVKVGGYPRPPETPGGDATHCLFDGIASAFRATKPTVLHWDDLGMAGGETLKAIVQLVQFGQIDGRRLPDCVVQCASSNDIGHGADVQGMIEPLKTRWHAIVKVETSVDEVVQHFLAIGMPSDLCAFLRNAPDALHDWKPSKSLSIEGATPRGWEYAGQWINMGVDDAEVLAGCVGKGRAAEYLEFRELINELPDVDAVLLNPESAPVPENPSARFLVSMALASKMTARNFGQCRTYLARLPMMFQAFSIKDAFRSEESRKLAKKLPAGYAALASSRDFTAWSVSAEGRDIVGCLQRGER